MCKILLWWSGAPLAGPTGPPAHTFTLFFVRCWLKPEAASVRLGRPLNLIQSYNLSVLFLVLSLCCNIFILMTMSINGGMEVKKVFIGAGCNRVVNNVSWGACDLVAFGAQSAVAIFSPKVPLSAF